MAKIDVRVMTASTSDRARDPAASHGRNSCSEIGVLEAELVQAEAARQVRVLDLDPVLLAAVPEEHQESARELLVAPSIQAATGPWSSDEISDRSGLGALVLEGLLTRNVEVAGERSREILGAGDIIRAWDDESGLDPVASTVTWTILEPTRLALLDRRWKLLAARWPELGDEVVHRVMRRSRWLATMLAIANLKGVESRVLLLLWHLAGSWGKVTAAGTLVPFALTHELIAELVGARRPSVTTAVTQLDRDGELERVDEGWLLCTAPPE